MALSLDDRLLGEKIDNYCSSSSEDEETGEDASEAVTNSSGLNLQGQSQTGPKGVLADYKRFQHMKQQEYLEEEKNLIEEVKARAPICRTYNEDCAAEVERREINEYLDSLEDDDEFIKRYRQRRTEDMKNALNCSMVYGRVLDLTADTFVDEIDQVPHTVAVLVHVFEPNNKACQKVDECFRYLSEEYPNSKFCRIRASSAHLSKQFSRQGVPAILVYRNGELIGNLLNVTRDLGNEFYQGDLENYLIEHGLLPDRNISQLLNDRLKTKSPTTCNS